MLELKKIRSFALTRLERALAGLREQSGKLNLSSRDGQSGEDSPLRARIFTRDEFLEHAHKLAANHRGRLGYGADRGLYGRFEENARLLDAARARFQEIAAQKRSLTPGCEWLLDNHHIIEEQINNIRRYLPRGYYRSLPKLSAGELKGFPRVYSLAIEYVLHSDAALDAELLAHFLRAYQDRASLTTGELWAVPIMLRLALIENLRRLISANMSLLARNETASSVLEECLVEGESSSATLLKFAAKIEEHGELLKGGAAEMLRLLRARGGGGNMALHWFEERLREAGAKPDDLIRQDQHAQAANQITIGNTVTSLRSILHLDWHDWFESVSLVHGTLERDPSGAYARSDFATRDAYWHSIEDLARLANRPELEVAQRAVELAAAFGGAQGEESERLRHVGYYLIDEGRRSLERDIACRIPPARRIARVLEDAPAAGYLGAILAGTVASVAALAVHCFSGSGIPAPAVTALCLLAAFPISETIVQLLQWGLLRVVPPSAMARYDYDDGIPPETKTLVVVNALLQDEQSVERLVDHLEVRFLANDDPALTFAILADLPDSDAEHSEDDRRILAHARELIDRLNSRHSRGGARRFLMLCRRRLWNASQRKFMGWERKRGKLMELNRLLLGRDSTTFQIDAATKDLIRGTRYVITLDSDSQLPRGSARRMVAAMAHPLNRPSIDPKTNIVVKGYAIMQPRVGTTLQSAAVSPFSRLFSRHAGLDPYTKQVSDLYQDLFGEGSYVGKGIYDVAAFERVLHDRVPENTLLSHDLFEGLFARTGLASHIEMLDDFPSRLNVHARRQHRWVRGDWQQLPWLFGSVPNARRSYYQNPLGLLARWKLFDNLRRSLLAPAVLLALVGGWLADPPGSGLWTLAALSPFLAGVLLSVVNGLMGFTRETDAAFHALRVAREVFASCVELGLSVCLLPYNALLMLHAVGVTLYRTHISRRNLLEWQTASHSEKVLANSLEAYVRGFAPSIALASIAVVAVAFVHPWRLLEALPFALLWCSSPWIAFRVRPPTRGGDGGLRPDQERYLLDAALLTWRYFDEHMDASQNHLIPDNLQMLPRRVLAERTSPTNISLSVLSVIAAYDLGFVPLPVVVRKLSPLFDTLSRLERYEGHFLNWYHTRTLQALAPRYVSTVDSGNLVGHLITSRAFFADFPGLTLVNASTWRLVEKRLIDLLSAAQGAPGIREAIGAALAGIEGAPSRVGEVRAALRTLQDLGGRLESEKRVAGADLSLAIDKLRIDLMPIADLAIHLECAGVAEALVGALSGRKELGETMRRLVEELSSLGSGPCTFANLERLVGLGHQAIKELFLLPDGSRDGELEAFVANLRGMEAKLRRSSLAISSLSGDVKRLAESASAIIDQTNFSFLYDETKKLFSIGYNLETARRDPSYYDFLASEARLASLVAIAKGDVPQEHWFMLGRSLTTAPGGKVLVSWSGTMFEYLMPVLVTRDYEGTLLSEAYRAAVRSQRIYCASKSVPWGISESGFSRQNFESSYQYKAFGVPALGLKRGLADDLVISPYSTFLALHTDPAACIENLHALDRLGMRGEYGYYEAIDFTPERLSRGEEYHVVASFLAHHQGMSLIAIDNLLRDGVMRERFHADPMIKATELLLHERFPDRIASQLTHQDEFSRDLSDGDEDDRLGRCEVMRTPFSRHPRTRLLSNGRLSVMMSNSGSGHTFFERKTSLTRWREDPLTDCSGFFLYFRDVKSGQVWSSGYQPTRAEPDSYEVFFGADKIEYKRSDFGIQTHTEITVSQDEDVEIRRVTLRNLTGDRRRVEVTSYGEVVLGNRQADVSHPAFSKLFVVSDYYPDLQALIFRRRPRGPDDEELFLLHSLSLPICWEHTQYETSRSRFLGRGNSLALPAALQTGEYLSGALGSVLDPIFSLRTSIEMNPGESQSLTFITGAGRSRQEMIRIAQHYQHYHSVQRAFEMAWSQSGIEIRQGNLSLQQINLFERLAAGIFYDVPEWRAKAETIEGNRLSQLALWRFGISGDEPIVLLKLNDPNQLGVVNELLDCHAYLGRKGLTFELVIYNEYPGGYMQELQQAIEDSIRNSSAGALYEKKGGVFLRSAQQISQEELGVLAAQARIVLNGSAGELKKQLRLAEPAGDIFVRGPSHALRPEPPGEVGQIAGSLELFNGYGGFADGGSAYVIKSGGALPPLPWSNVIANEGFGALVTDTGGGYTWSGNSRENRITEWSNDPITDARGEALYLRDSDSGAYWSATPLPCGHGHPYEIRHGFGYSRFSCRQNSISSVLTIFCDESLPVKHFDLEISNQHYTDKTIELYFYAEWVLGVERFGASRHVVTDFDDRLQVLLATNHYNPDFAGRVAFAGSSENLDGYTANRLEFIGRFGDTSTPFMLERAHRSNRPFFALEEPRLSLSGKTGARMDPCGLLRVTVSLQPGEEGRVSFFMGQAASAEEALDIAGRCKRPNAASQAHSSLTAAWSGRLGDLEVKTPERSFDILVNGWLLYQTVACRLWGRSGFYQSGGAFGFRDQLQDSMALAYFDPGATRRQILLNASRQFKEGDVQHWWHPPSGKGVRTRISDNLLWMPFALHHYLEVTGDWEILDEEVGFLEGPPLEPHEHDRYFLPSLSRDKATLYDHCWRAIDRALGLIGERGLALMGTGDWNDGMNHVGPAGKGESVWLTWFLADVAGKFAGISDKAGRPEISERLRAAREQLVSAIEKCAWDGRWYRRAFFDDGTPLGSAGNDECQIDSLAQTWGVLSGAADPERSEIAMRSVFESLVNEDAGIIALLSPPFDSGSLKPGYIKGYPPGIRENGGQYTHAATWVVMAAALRGDGDRALRLFQLLNPIRHALDSRAVSRYQTEPYVLCGDVYSMPPHSGRGGWSWYTGSSGWLYRAAVENILGLKVRPDHLSIEPCIPSDWPEYSMRIRLDGVTYSVTVENPAGVCSGVSKVVVNGRVAEDGRIPRSTASGQTIAVTVTLEPSPDPDGPAPRGATDRKSDDRLPEQ